VLDLSGALVHYAGLELSRISTGERYAGKEVLVRGMRRVIPPLAVGHAAGPLQQTRKQHTNPRQMWEPAHGSAEETRKRPYQSMPNVGALMAQSRKQIVNAPVWQANISEIQPPG
jgi:hypothetical protein